MAMAGSLSTTADFFFWLCLKNSKIELGGSAVALCDGLLRLSQSSGPQNRAMHGGWRVDPRDSRVTGEQEEFEGFFLPFPSL